MILGRDEVVRRIRSAGLHRVEQTIEGLVLDSIRISTEPSSGEPLGVSKLGGTPDLPVGEEWPAHQGSPLAFIGQFRMDETTRYDTEKLLPRAGMMWFFYDAKEQPWGDSAERGGWRAIYRDVDAAALRRAEPPEALPEECRFVPCRARFSPESTLPAYESYGIQALGLDGDEVEAYTELVGGLGGDDTGRHRLLGHPDVIQNEMETQCEQASRAPYYSYFEEGRRPAKLAELAERGRQWRLLLQIDSDDAVGTQWGDIGRIYYWARADSVRELNLDDVWLVLQCY